MDITINIIPVMVHIKCEFFSITSQQTQNIELMLA